jgi:ElaB/YqjD/DUF883 family membrane-anchored ribosome-binding protein
MTSVHREAGQEPGLTEKASASVQDAASTAQEKAGELKERGQHRLAEQFDERSTQVGSEAHTMAQAIRQSCEQLHQEGKDTSARLVEQAADRIQGLGSYLEAKGGSEMLRDVEDFARRRPWFVAGIGLAAGLVASRFLKASSERRYEASPRAQNSGPTFRGTGYSRAYDTGTAGDAAAGAFTNPASAPLSRDGGE